MKNTLPICCYELIKHNAYKYINITFPREVVELCNLELGDFFEITREENKLYIKLVDYKSTAKLIRQNESGFQININAEKLGYSFKEINKTLTVHQEYSIEEDSLVVELPEEFFVQKNRGFRNLLSMNKNEKKTKGFNLFNDQQNKVA